MKKHKKVSFWICVTLKVFFFPTPYSQEDFEYVIYQFAFHLYLIQFNFNLIFIKLNLVKLELKLVELEFNSNCIVMLFTLQFHVRMN
jgi:hypothetical protein